MALNHWMSWESGMEVTAATTAGGSPSLVLHLARMLHTPIGSARGGMLFWQPDPAGDPLVLCSVTTDSKVGDYCRSHLFPGTLFEEAPPVLGDISIEVHPDDVFARIAIPGFIFDLRLSGIATAILSDSPAATPALCHHRRIRSDIHRTTLKLNGRTVDLASARSTFSPCGFKARD
jgi:hypothetical protein